MPCSRSCHCSSAGASTQLQLQLQQQQTLSASPAADANEPTFASIAAAEDSAPGAILPTAGFAEDICPDTVISPGMGMLYTDLSLVYSGDVPSLVLQLTISGATGTLAGGVSAEANAAAAEVAADSAGLEGEAAAAVIAAGTAGLGGDPSAGAAEDAVGNAGAGAAAAAFTAGVADMMDAAMATAGFGPAMNPQPHPASISGSHYSLPTLTQLGRYIG